MQLGDNQPLNMVQADDQNFLLAKVARRENERLNFWRL